MTSKLFLIILPFFISNTVLGQINSKHGQSFFKPYDRTFISPEIKQKHGYSLGMNISYFTNKSFPLKDTSINDEPLGYQTQHAGFSIGYHYLFIKSKKLTLSKKRRNELSGLNLYLNGYGAFLNTELSSIPKEYISHEKKYTWSQIEARGSFTQSFLSYRGKIMSFYLLNEIGMSLFFRNMSIYDKTLDRPVKAFFCFSPLNIKLGKLPLFFKSSVNLAVDNHPLQREKLESSINLGIQLYLYKYK